MSLAQQQESLIALCFGPEPAEHALAAIGSQPDRLRLYRSMVQGRIVEMVESAIPRSVASLGRSEIAAAVRAYLAECPPASPFIRDVPMAFRSWLRRRADLALRQRQWDLIEWEIEVWSASFAPAAPPPIEPFSFDHPPVINPTLRTLELSHGVHRSGDDGVADASGSVTVAVFRNLETHIVMWRELEPFGRRFLESVRSRPAASVDTLRDVAASLGVSVDPDFVDRATTILSSWLDDGLLLGSSPGRA